MTLSLSRSRTAFNDTIIQDHQQSTRQVKPWGADFHRRRKTSVPELSALMTTVQENAQDSPTIPGRTPLYRSLSDYSIGHERCSSVPGNSWRNNPFGDALVSRVTGPITMPIEYKNGKGISQSTFASVSPRRGFLADKRSLSPISSQTTASRPALKEVTATNINEDDEDKPPLPLYNSPFLDRRFSPTISHQSAPASAGRRSLNFPVAPMVPGSSPHRVMVPYDHQRISPLAVVGSTPVDPMRLMHSRDATDTSIKDRGRPSKKQVRQRAGTEASRPVAVDNWILPPSLSLSEASLRLAEDEIRSLRKQSLDQAGKFAILHKSDVASLSRELRALDERCEYLRKTYKSLRDGRQKLHSRMIAFLKRTEIAFSRGNLLKQEEALSELDTSIDDWIVKIEQVENQRLRIRQKLLEHVAAALLLKPAAAGDVHRVAATSSPRSPSRTDDPMPVEMEYGDVESIRIYIDDRALDLFSEVERQTGQMCEFSMIHDIRPFAH